MTLPFEVIAGTVVDYGTTTTTTGGSTPTGGTTGGATGSTQASSGGQVTAEDVYAYFRANGVDPTWQYGPDLDPNPDARMQRIADQLNGPGYDWSDLDISLGHLRVYHYGSEASRVLPAGGGPAEEIDTALSREEQRREMELVYGWLPDQALNVWMDEWVESGNKDAAWAIVRQNAQYEQWFPGNLTEDGRVRYSEETYATVTAAYDDVFRAAGIDGQALEYMQARYGDLIRGEVAPSELETNRVKPMYDRIMSQSDYIKNYYAENYGIGVSDQDLLVSAMDPALGELVLTQQIKFAEIGGEGIESGFDMTSDRVQRLADVAGFDREAANELFQDAETMVPLLTTLAKRHNDPDDEFDLDDFVASQVFADPDQAYRMRRMVAQERSLFRGGLSARQDQSGAMTGLLAQ